MELDCTSLSSLLRNLHILAKHFDLSTHSDPDDSRHARDLLAGLILIVNDLSLNGAHSLLFFDDVSSDVERVLSKDILRTCNFKILLTSNNVHWHSKSNVMIPVFDQEEMFNLVKDQYSHKYRDTDVLDLADQVGYLPLGMVVSIELMQRQKKSIKKFIATLKSDNLPKGDDVFEENEYRMGLKATLNMAINDIKDHISPEMFSTFQLIAFTQPSNIPLDAFQLALPGTTQDQINQIDELVEAIGRISLGVVEIVGANETRILNTHVLIQKTLRSQWNKKEQGQKVQEMLCMMSKLCSTDTRFVNNFEDQLQLLPHMESILCFAEKHPHDQISSHIAVIQMLVNVGHMHTQILNPLKSEPYMLKAIKQFLWYFLHVRIDQFTMEGLHSPVKMHARLQEISGSESTQVFLDIVMQKCYTQDYILPWQERGLSGYELKEERELSQMSKPFYNDLLSIGAAQHGKIIQETFISELLVHILYTYSKIYFYKTDKCIMVSSDEKKNYKRAMQYAYDLSKEILAKQKVHIMSLLLIQRNGLLYYELQEAEDPAKISNVLLEYQRLYHDSNDYFDFGFLKKIKSDKYHKRVCIRQIVICYNILIKLSSGEQRVKLLENVQDFAKELENVEMSSVTSLNQCTFMNVKAQLLVLMAGKENLEKACALYKESCDREVKSGHVKYSWIHALKGLVNLVGMGIACKDEVKKRIDQYNDLVTKQGGSSSKEVQELYLQL